MRALIVIPLLLAAACSAEEQKVEATAATLQAGQWQVTSEVVSMESMDKGKPRLAAKAGDKTEETICLGAAETRSPPPALFVGSDDAEGCSYATDYVRNGRINASLRCPRAAMGGDITHSLDGDFKADSFDATLLTETGFASDGDVKIKGKLTGRRTGECTPAAG